MPLRLRSHRKTLFPTTGSFGEFFQVNGRSQVVRCQLLISIGVGGGVPRSHHILMKSQKIGGLRKHPRRARRVKPVLKTGGWEQRWFSKRCSQTRSTATPWELVKNANSWPRLRRTESQTLGARGRPAGLSQAPPGERDAHLNSVLGRS